MNEEILEFVIVAASEQSNDVATADSNLVQDLGLDSLDLVSLAQSLEQQFPELGEIDYDPERMQTVRDVAEFIEERLAERTGVNK